MIKALPFLRLEDGNKGLGAKLIEVEEEEEAS